jgi:hypothetical protein
VELAGDLKLKLCLKLQIAYLLQQVEIKGRLKPGMNAAAPGHVAPLKIGSAGVSEDLISKKTVKGGKR